MSNKQADMHQHEQEMREAFEDTYRSRLILDRKVSGEYVFTRAITAWDAWQAATLAAEETFNQRLVELTSRIRELEADAKRYRWLRDGCCDDKSDATYIVEHYFGPSWDEKIDRAMEHEHKENQG